MFITNQSMRKLSFLLPCLFLVNIIYCQTIFINYDIDTTRPSIAHPLKCWIDFLNTKDDSLGARYWNKEEVKQYGYNSYFLLESHLDFGSPNLLQVLGYSSIKVLSVIQQPDYYKITSQMEFKPNGNRSNIQYIFSVYAKAKGTEFKLYNALTVHSALHLNHSTLGFVEYYYPKSHRFNKELAQQQDELLLSLCKNLELQPTTVRYYFADTQEEINRIKGFDFIIGSSGEQLPSGIADPDHHIVYSSGLYENYPHEIIHVLLRKKYPQLHYWFDEGVATCFGQSRGKDLDWHLQKVNTYLKAHPEVDLNQLLTLRNLDGSTGFKYALGGFLIQYAKEKGGFDLIKKLLLSGETDEQFYEALKNLLGIAPDQINNFIRTELAKRYASAKK